MATPTPLLLVVLLRPEGAPALGLADWDLLVRQARAAKLLGRLRDVLQAHGLLDAVPAAPRLHLEAAQRIAERQRISVAWELDQLASVLAKSVEPVVVLKGAAYAALDLGFARTRLFSDVDLLVPHTSVGTAESELLIHGWCFDDMPAYDQQYYRRWMHELPPLRNRRRGTVLDLHHSLLPPTARLKLDTTSLFDELVPLPAHPGLSALAPTTQLLHSATHLFHEGEFSSGLRDLFDLDGLIRQFGPAPGFWPALARRSQALGTGRPLYYALTLCQRLLATPLPEAALADCRRQAPPQPLAALMLWLFSQALAPVHTSCAQPSRQLARTVLYLRGHWLRMPTGLLLAHLARKAWRRLSGAEAREAERRQRLADATAQKL